MNAVCTFGGGTQQNLHFTLIAGLDANPVTIVSSDTYSFPVPPEIKALRSRGCKDQSNDGSDEFSAVSLVETPTE